MSIQNILNKQTINLLPEIKSLLILANDFNFTQMHSYTIRECLNSRTAIANMSKKQLKKFESDLIARFQQLNWL